jgi:hypothetical protein
MLGNLLSRPRTGTPIPARWRNRIKVSVVVYGVAATYDPKFAGKTNPEPINDEILNLMRSAKLRAVN